MNTDRERWRRVTELFHAALERPPAERDAFLTAACSNDPALLAEVRSLLAGHARAADAKLIEGPAVADDPGFLEEAAATQEASLKGRTIGPYRIQREIARGGMGIVYLAEDTRLGRPTALKALPAVFAEDDDRRERLRREARAAADARASGGGDRVRPRGNRRGALHRQRIHRRAQPPRRDPPRSARAGRRRSRRRAPSRRPSPPRTRTGSSTAI